MFTEKTNLLDYLASLKANGYSSSYINNMIGTARVYARFCEEKGIPFDKTLLDLKFVKETHKPRATMTPQEIDAFLSLPPKEWQQYNQKAKKTITYKQNYKIHHYWTVFFSIIAFTGMRTGECAKLTIDDCDFVQHVFTLKDTKTNDNRLVPIPENIYGLIKDWSDIQKNYLFPAKTETGHTNESEWHYNFHDRIKRLGIKRANLTPYSLRHSYITEMLQQDGVNIYDVQALVGHRDIKTTANYYHLGLKRKIQVSGKHPCVRKSLPPSKIFDNVEDFFDGLGLDERFKLEKHRKNGQIMIKIEAEASPNQF